MLGGLSGAWAMGWCLEGALPGCAAQESWPGRKALACSPLGHSGRPPQTCLRRLSQEGAQGGRQWLQASGLLVMRA